MIAMSGMARTPKTAKNQYIVPEAYAHVRPVNVGRHATSDKAEIREWEPGETLRGMMRKFGYRLTPSPQIEPKPIAPITTAAS